MSRIQELLDELSSLTTVHPVRANEIAELQAEIVSKQATNDSLSEECLRLKRREGEAIRLAADRAGQIANLRNKLLDLEGRLDKATKIVTGLPSSELSNEHLGEILNGQLRKKSDELLLKECGGDPARWATAFMEEMTFGPTFDHTYMAKWFGLVMQFRPTIPEDKIQAFEKWVWFNWTLCGAMSLKDWMELTDEERTMLCKRTELQVAAQNREIGA